VPKKAAGKKKSTRKEVVAITKRKGLRGSGPALKKKEERRGGLKIIKCPLGPKKAVTIRSHEGDKGPLKNFRLEQAKE